MTEYQITSWRGIPSLVVARSGAETSKVSLPARFQEAIDEYAMRLGQAGSDAYLDGWERSAWEKADGAPSTVAESVAADLERAFTDARMQELIDAS